MTSDPFNPCILIPTYDNPGTIERVVRGVRRHLGSVVVVDDGSGDAARQAIDRLTAEGLAIAARHPRNRGKGAAVVTGFSLARERGFTHALQVDGDDQHDIGCIPSFLAAAAAAPRALILGYPVYDESVPGVRKSGREVARFWVDLEIGRGRVRDPMTGFRVYPLPAAMACGRLGTGMEFDIEIVVRMVWSGVDVVNLPVGVRYLTAEEGGVSHFRMVRDNARITWLHTRLASAALWRRARGRK